MPIRKRLAHIAAYTDQFPVWDERAYPDDAEAYELDKELGRGATAAVWLARCSSLDAPVAVKVVDMDIPDSAQELLSREADTMRALRHPNLLPMFCSFTRSTPAPDALCLVLPFVPGGSLEDILRSQFPTGMDEPLVAAIARDVLQGLDFLHQHDHMHRDLKAANLLVNEDGRILLADFGVAAALKSTDVMVPEPPPTPTQPPSSRRLTLRKPKEAKGAPAPPPGRVLQKRTTFAGTPCFMAPEVVEQIDGYGPPADVWSFGILVLELAMGRPPRVGRSLTAIILSTMHDDAPQLTASNFSQEAKAFVAACLQKDPALRPTPEALLKHPFIQGAKGCDYLCRRLLGQQPSLLRSTTAPASSARGSLFRRGDKSRKALTVLPTQAPAFASQAPSVARRSDPGLARREAEVPTNAWDASPGYASDASAHDDSAHSHQELPSAVALPLTTSERTPSSSNLHIVRPVIIGPGSKHASGDGSGSEGGGSTSESELPGPGKHRAVRDSAEPRRPHVLTWRWTHPRTGRAHVMTYTISAWFRRAEVVVDGLLVLIKRHRFWEQVRFRGDKHVLLLNIAALGDLGGATLHLNVRLASKHKSELTGEAVVDDVPLPEPTYSVLHEDAAAAQQKHRRFAFRRKPRDKKKGHTASGEAVAGTDILVEASPAGAEASSVEGSPTGSLEAMPEWLQRAEVQDSLQQATEALGQAGLDPSAEGLVLSKLTLDA